MPAPETSIETLMIGGEKFYIGRVVNIDAMIDEIDEKVFEQDERLPYWAELWPSAIAFSEYVLENRHEFRDKRLLEIGSGLGLSGIAATKAGAKVLFSDYEADALQMIRANFKRNFNRSPAVALIDWRKPALDQLFDVIIASDILYENRWLNPVKMILNRFLLHDGRAIIAEPGRTIARPFFETMIADGWKDQICKRTVLFDHKKSTVNIHRLQRC